jgi:hypothetical protein
LSRLAFAEASVLFLATPGLRTFGAAATAAAAKEIYVFLSDGTNWYGNQAGTGYA